MTLRRLGRLIALSPLMLAVVSCGGTQDESDSDTRASKPEDAWFETTTACLAVAQDLADRGFGSEVGMAFYDDYGRRVSGSTYIDEFGERRQAEMRTTGPNYDPMLEEAIGPPPTSPARSADQAPDLDALRQHRDMLAARNSFIGAIVALGQDREADAQATCSMVVSQAAGTFFDNEPVPTPEYAPAPIQSPVEDRFACRDDVYEQLPEIFYTSDPDSPTDAEILSAIRPEWREAAQKLVEVFPRDTSGWAAGTNLLELRHDWAWAGLAEEICHFIEVNGQ